MSQEDGLQIKVKLKGEALKKFLYIKEKLGLETYAEVVRYLISQQYDRITSARE